jgi:hypothetical protein
MNQKIERLGLISPWGQGRSNGDGADQINQRRSDEADAQCHGVPAPGGTGRSRDAQPRAAGLSRGGGGVEEERAARGGEKEGAPSPYIAARGFTGALLPTRAKSSLFPRELPPATSPAARFRQCAARNCSPRKRTLAAFPGSHPEASLLAVFSQAAKRANLANKATCSPRVQPGYWVTLPNTPLKADDVRRFYACSSRS